MPTITYRPKDVAIDQHGEAIFVCEAEGNPPPLVFWSLEGNHTLIFSGEKHGKFRAGINKSGQSVLTVQVNLNFFLFFLSLPLSSSVKIARGRYSQLTTFRRLIIHILKREGYFTVS